MTRERVTFRIADSVEHERRFNRFAASIYEQELGLKIDDDLDAVYADTFHLTLLGEVDGVIVGGMKAYVAGGDLGGGLPMERDGVPVAEFHREAFADDPRRCEICRVVADRAYGRLDLIGGLLRLLEPELRVRHCPAIYWLANAHQTVNSHRAARGLGLTPRLIRRISLTRPGSVAARELHWSYASLRDAAQPHSASA